MAAAELKRGGGVRELYSALAYGRLAAKDIAAKLEGASQQGEPSPSDAVTAGIPRGLRSLFGRPRRDSDHPGVVVSGEQDH